MQAATTPLNARDRAAVPPTSTGQTYNATRAYGWLMSALVLLFVVNIFVFASRPAEGSSYAVIVPPHLGQVALMETIAAAGGTLVRESRYPWLAIVNPATGTEQAGFASALRQAGALLLLHPAVVAGCLTPNSNTENVASRPPSHSPS